MKKQPEPFVGKRYYYDDRPGVDGNGFNNLEIGIPEDRVEAGRFIDYINQLIEERAMLLVALQQVQTALDGDYLLRWVAVDTAVDTAIKKATT